MRLIAVLNFLEPIHILTLSLPSQPRSQGVIRSLGLSALCGSLLFFSPPLGQHVPPSQSVPPFTIAQPTAPSPYNFPHPTQGISSSYSCACQSELEVVHSIVFPATRRSPFAICITSAWYASQHHSCRSCTPLILLLFKRSPAKFSAPTANAVPNCSDYTLQPVHELTGGSLSGAAVSTDIL